MQVLIVTFRLEGMTEAEYYRGCDEEAPAFVEIPGLIAKIWLADPATNTYGGVYTLQDRASLDAYLASDLFRSIGETPGVAGLTVQRFGALEGPTRVTPEPKDQLVGCLDQRGGGLPPTRFLP
jgi:hypothetical protein